MSALEVGVPMDEVGVAWSSSEAPPTVTTLLVLTVVNGCV